MTKTPPEDGDYLWDGSGEPDPEVVRLESLLAPLRHRGSVPALPPRRRMLGPRVTTWIVPALSAAAALLLVAAGAWFVYGLTRSGWSVQSLAGMPVVDGAPLSGARGGVSAGKTARLGVGEWLVTDAVSRARIAVGQIGRVDVEPNTRMQLVEARGREHRMSLVRGTIHARIWAPPRSMPAYWASCAWIPSPISTIAGSTILSLPSPSFYPSRRQAGAPLSILHNGCGVPTVPSALNGVT